MSQFESIADKRLILVGGKGGVGRTTVAAAMGTVLARRGRRVLLAHVRCRRSLGELLGCDKIGEEISQVEPNLWAVNMDPAAAIREMGLLVLRFRALYRAVLENRLVKHFLKAVPALEQYSMLGKAWYHTTEKLDGEPKYNTVIFDGPATGHLISMLRIPQVILDAVPSGPLTKDAKKAQELLSDPKQTSLWIVTLAEEMSVTESLDLYKAAKEELHIGVGGLIVNALYPDDFEKDPELVKNLEKLESKVDDSCMKSLVISAKTIHNRRQINQKCLDFLEEKIPLPRIELPYLFVDKFDRAALDVLAKKLEDIP